MPRIKFAFLDHQYRDNGAIEKDLGSAWKKRIFEIVLTNVCSSLRNEGLKGPEARTYNRILDALDKAKNDHIDLIDDDAKFLRAILKHEDVKIAPLQSRIFCLMQDAIDEAFEAKDLPA